MAGLLALAAAGLVVVLVDTVRLHRLDAATRAAGRGRVSHYPVVAHAYRYPPKHRISALFGKLLAGRWIVLTFSFLPNQVNAVAFLAGAGAPRRSPWLTARRVQARRVRPAGRPAARRVRPGGCGQAGAARRRAGGLGWPGTG